MAAARVVESQHLIAVTVSKSRLQAMAKRRRHHGNATISGKATTADTSDISNTAISCAKVILPKLLSGDFDAADAYLDEKVKDFRGTSCKAFYHSIINACARAGSADAAVWCAVRMVRIGLRPNVVTFNSLLDASAKAGDLKLATYVWRVMLEYGIKPNEITFNTMINACAQARDGPMAEVWLEKMQAEGLKPCAVSFSTLMAAFAKTGRADKAELWFERMREARIEPDRIIFNSMVDVSRGASAPDRAEHWLLRMMEAGIKPEKKVFTSVIQAWGKHADLERAEYWFTQMEKFCKTDKATFAALVHASIKSGNIQRAETWLSAMVSRGMAPTTSMYNDVLHHAFEVQTDYEGAMRWYSKMLADGIKPNTGTYNRLYNICQRSGKRCSVLESMGFVGNHATEEEAEEDGTDDSSGQGCNHSHQGASGLRLPSSEIGKLREMMASSGGKFQGPPGLELPAHLAFPAASEVHGGRIAGGPFATQPGSTQFHKSCPSSQPQLCPPVRPGGQIPAPKCPAYSLQLQHPQQPQAVRQVQPQHPQQPHTLMQARGMRHHPVVGGKPMPEPPRMIGPVVTMRKPLTTQPMDSSSEEGVQPMYYCAMDACVQQNGVERSQVRGAAGAAPLPMYGNTAAHRSGDGYEQMDYPCNYYGGRPSYFEAPCDWQIEYPHKPGHDEQVYVQGHGRTSFDYPDYSGPRHLSNQSSLEDLLHEYPHPDSLDLGLVTLRI